MKRRNSLVTVAIFVFSGCAVINPYEGEFSCPDTFHGKCISVSGAYQESLKDKDVDYDKAQNSCIGGDCPDQKEYAYQPSRSESVEDRNYNAYRSSLYNRYDQLLREPQTPVVVPPKVMRVLLLPYKGQDGEFYMYRHVYFFAEEPKWILGDSVEAFDY